MFGNIDEVECTRSMVRARTSTATDLFVMRTTEYYSLLQNGYIFIYRKMHHFLLLHNLVVPYTFGSNCFFFNIF